MKDITTAFKQAVKQELKNIDRFSHGDWSDTYTNLKEPFFVISSRQFNDHTAMPRSLWHGLWHQGEMCCLFGSPNVGKSVLANMIAYDIATTELDVLYIDFENSPHQAAARYHSPGKPSQLAIPHNISFVTVNPQISYKYTRNYNIVLDAIEHEFVTQETPVVIIDDISHICPLRDCKAAQEVMQRMRQWIIKYSVSILVIAHAVKHRSACPLTISSLFGASHTAYCFDSIFAIGRDMRDDSKRYIKQLKSRITAIKHGADNVISTQLVTIGDFLCFDILGAGLIERDLLAIPEITDKQALHNEIKRLLALDWSARQIAKRLDLSHTTINSIISNIELTEITNAENVETVETVEKTAENVETTASCVETSTEMKNLFSQQIQQLAQSAHLPSVQAALESRNLPFADWKPDDDPNISQICLYRKENPLYSLLDRVHCSYVYSSYDDFTLHVHDYNAKTHYRYGALVYSPTLNIIGRADVGIPDWFPGTIPSDTSIQDIEKSLHQAARILRDKVMCSNADMMDPSVLTDSYIETAASTVNLPAAIIASALYLPYEHTS